MQDDLSPQKKKKKTWSGETGIGVAPASILMFCYIPLLYVHSSKFILLPGKALFIIAGASCVIIKPEEKEENQIDFYYNAASLNPRWPV